MILCTCTCFFFKLLDVIHSSMKSIIHLLFPLNDQFIVGDGNNMYDFTYVENVAHAHVCAERALASEGKVAETAAGQVLV